MIDAKCQKCGGTKGLETRWNITLCLNCNPILGSVERIEKALAVAIKYGLTDGAHHKMWVIDQMVRALTGCSAMTTEDLYRVHGAFTFMIDGESQEYIDFAKAYSAENSDGDMEAEWDTGVAP